MVSIKKRQAWCQSAKMLSLNRQTRDALFADPQEETELRALYEKCSKVGSVCEPFGDGDSRTPLIHGVSR